MTRRELLRQLAEQDVDYLADVLGLTSADLIRKFPSRVAAFLDQEADDNTDEEVTDE